MVTLFSTTSRIELTTCLCLLPLSLSRCILTRFALEAESSYSNGFLTYWASPLWYLISVLTSEVLERFRQTANDWIRPSLPPAKKGCTLFASSEIATPIFHVQNSDYGQFREWHLGWHFQFCKKILFFGHCYDPVQVVANFFYETCYLVCSQTWSLFWVTAAWKDKSRDTIRDAD